MTTLEKFALEDIVNGWGNEEKEYVSQLLNIEPEGSETCWRCEPLAEKLGDIKFDLERFVSDAITLMKDADQALREAQQRLKK